MGRRTSKKNKKIKLTDKHSPMTMDKLTGRKMAKKMLKSGTYKASDRFTRKSRANSQLGELFTPIVEDYPRDTRIPIAICTNLCQDRASEHELFNPIYYAPGEPYESNRGFLELLKKDWDIKDECAICKFPLTAKYPDDYPDEYKFCCNCFKWAKKLVETEKLVGYCSLKIIVKESPVLKKIVDRITLVKGNERKK